MLNKIFFVCLFVGLYSAGASLSCRWMEQKFRQYNGNSLTLLDTMVTNSTNSTEDAAAEDAVAFPNELYKLAFRASAEDRTAFTAQILEEIAGLFEDRSPLNGTVWEESTVDNFINLITQQAEGLRSCIVSHSHKKKNKKLSLYFKRLSHHAEQMDDAWELIRKEAHAHLLRAGTLVTSVLTEN